VEHSGKVTQISDSSQTHGITATHSRYLLVLIQYQLRLCRGGCIFLCLLVSVSSIAWTVMEKIARNFWISVHFVIGGLHSMGALWLLLSFESQLLTLS